MNLSYASTVSAASADFQSIFSRLQPATSVTTTSPARATPANTRVRVTSIPFSISATECGTCHDCGRPLAKHSSCHAILGRVRLLQELVMSDSPKRRLLDEI